jgi:hypothetical protein
MAALRQGEAYGYQLLQRLSSAAGLSITESTVYPILSRLTGFSERKDVADHFKAPGMRGSGFMFCIPYTHMQSGPSSLRLLARDGDGTLYEFYRNDINIAATLVAGGDEPRITRAKEP